MTKARLLLAMAAMLIVVSARSPGAATNGSVPLPAREFRGTLNVLTYNVKGMPWPIATGRSYALEAIGRQLRSLHEKGAGPQVVVLQEAFTSDAQEVGRRAGYRFIANGPGPDDLNTQEMNEADRRYVSGARWWKGEAIGKFVGSGLQILSDYPIVAVHRLAFPVHACAGYDCLANKGALLVTLDIPGAPGPVDILTTHLNSRGASGVSDARTLYAYRRQVDALSAFVRQVHVRRYPLIAAGDYNVGSVRPRYEALLGATRTGWKAGFNVYDALGEFTRRGGRLNGDAAYTYKRARDWQFFSNGEHATLAVTGIEVPFGRTGTGGMLSDHIGYTARFEVMPRQSDDLTKS